jgi:hypothetical protein
MTKIIDEGYNKVFKKNFPRNGFSWETGKQPYPSLVIVELYHYPKYQRVDKGEKMTRSLLSYLSANY